MPRKLPPHVERNRVKGKDYFSFRIGKGRRTRLPGDPNSEEFKDAYIAAFLGEAAPVRYRFSRAAPGTLGALIASYMNSASYIGLRETTKVGYRSRIETLRTKHGHRTVAGLSRERIITGILQPYASRPGAAISILKMLRVLIHHAIDIGWLKHDPSLGIKRPKLKRVRSWTENEIATFRAHWPLDSKQRTAFELFLNTGQRRSDVVQMIWPHIANNKISVTQQKTGRKLVVPLHSDLVAALAAADHGNITILTTEYGKPFTVDGFSGWMRSAIAEAGLPLACQPHGLRKAAGRRLAEAGATAKMIMSVLGHRSLAEAERYTEDADQAGLAEDAVAILEGHKWNGIAQTASRSLGKTAKRKGKSK